jgi:outer membrane protein assembly factor BamB
VREVPWPTYGFDNARSHVGADFTHMPPYRRVWLAETGHLIEFPPAVAYDKVYVAQVKGRFFAYDTKTGAIRWKKDFKHCEAAGPTVWRGVVYQAYMQPLPCDRFPRDQPGFVVAMNADTGKELWRFRGKPFESSPLIVRGTLYVGSWDHHLYAINARTKALRWKFEADGEVNTSAAYGDGAVYFATDAGSVYALDARTGRQIWKRSDGSEYFYATPTIAYGRVYIGNTNGALYAYGMHTGDLLWVAHAGTYIYTAAAVWDKTVYVGSYDGGFYAFDAATGDQKWRYEAPAAIHGAPTVMAGLVYFSTCEFCGVRASRYAKQGPRGTYALDAKTGTLVWQSRAGQYSPIVADRERVYLVGKTRIYALEEPARRYRGDKVEQRPPTGGARSFAGGKSP